MGNKESVFNIANKLIKGHCLSKKEYMVLIENANNAKLVKFLADEAVALRQRYYGKKVFTRGLIEFTNYCKNDCYYCGIRHGNKNAVRYRLMKEDILECCNYGYELGFHTFVLQGGEDPYFTDERVVDIVRSIKAEHPDCAVTLSIGEKSYESYRLFREAGADRYLLRHETANDCHYNVLHPQEMKLSNRKQCLYDLKSLGYQVGAGCMVGTPGQTVETLAEDMVFLQELQPQMVGIGPFIPHHDTKFANEPSGSVELTLFLLSLARIMLPKSLIPATTALGTADDNGREKGMAVGCNVVMPNLSPLKNRKNYDLYDNKISTGEEAAESKKAMERRMRSVGYELVYERGDAVST